MQTIRIEPIPNQKFSIRLDGDRYEIEIKAMDSTPIMVMSIIRNGEIIVSSARAVAGFPIIPYNYLERGNFVFITPNDELPDWRKFASTHSMIFASASEIEAIRNV